MTRGTIAFEVLLVLSLGASAGQLKLDQYYYSGAVFQRGVKIPVAGKAAAGAEVKLTFDGRTVSGKADAQGRWRIALPAHEAGGPYALAVSSGAETLTATNVLVGEVWLVSGQSNAYFPVNRFAAKDEWAKGADHPTIRFMTISWQPPHMRRPDKWRAVTPTSVMDCSATGFFFAKELQRALKVPVGVVVAAADGSIIQKWVSEPALRKVPGMKAEMAKHEAAAKVWGEYQAELARRKKLPADEAKALGELKRPPYPAKQYAGLFEEYIEPMIPFPFKGVIWYQGEANAMFAQGYVYRFYLQEMIRDWRARWQAPEMPFLVVQLPHYNRSYIWGDLRDSQNFVAAAEKNVKIVPTFDIGDMKNIHPPKKPELGARLSRFARQFVYGEKGVKAEGPVFAGVEPKGGELLVKFTAGAALASSDGEPIRGLTVAGKDGRHVDATVRIVDANTLSVSSPQVKEPVAVRYGWATPDRTNFADAEGRPVGAFRSDNGKLATQ